MKRRTSIEVRNEAVDRNSHLQNVLECIRFASLTNVLKIVQLRTQAYVNSNGSTDDFVNATHQHAVDIIALLEQLVCLLPSGHDV